MSVSPPTPKVGSTSSGNLPRGDLVETAVDSRTTAGGRVSEGAVAWGADASGVDTAVVAPLAGPALDAGPAPFATVSEDVLACGADISGNDDVASSVVALTEAAFGLTAIALRSGEDGPASPGLNGGSSACNCWFDRAGTERSCVPRLFVADGAASCTDRPSGPTYQHLYLAAAEQRRFMLELNSARQNEQKLVA